MMGFLNVGEYLAVSPEQLIWRDSRPPQSWKVIVPPDAQAYFDEENQSGFATCCTASQDHWRKAKAIAQARNDNFDWAELEHEYYWVCPHCNTRNSRKSKPDLGDTCTQCSKFVNLWDYTQQ